MYNIEELKKEKDSCRKKIITFSVLTGVTVVLIILAIIAYVLGLVFVLESGLDEETIGRLTILVVALFVVSIVVLCLAACAFIPFIVINSVKYGKRRRLLDKIENDNGVING